MEHSTILNKSGQKILFVCPYPFDEAPSQRFRYEQYLTILKENGFKYDLAPFLSIKAWNILYKEGALLLKVWAVIIGFAKRKLLLLKLKSYDFIFIHREATPLGPPFFEWVVKHVWRKKIIYDFDDAIWLTDHSEARGIKAVVKWKSKVAKICKWSYKVSCGNEYLAEFARQWNNNVIVNPTTIDTVKRHVPDESETETDQRVIGWTGTHSTLPYLKSILSVLLDLYEQHQFTLKVIANKKPDFDFPELEFIFWDKVTEIKDLQGIDVGLMPLTDDQWSKGKCGFKALQFMALEIPVVASPVGVNNNIVPYGGFLANESIEWKEKLQQLIEDKKVRKELGTSGRTFVKKYYSVSSNTAKFLYLFKK
ncbi:glycosyltransferase family 4 protein [Marivirga atlantica]|jgi:glycosyltransferase involved in cell wall biosynthesis|uniref:Glycosyltransferase family 4 protein n=1 Tax=Marivirga atlantica TaxID=1548457 RepID=A0A937DJG0_9BACT|nr:glycosyltransferase [Marivirga atlantica]MBL0765171.1 glycosyltransferase family 4 protein [Marivirga atlantica]